MATTHRKLTDDPIVLRILGLLQAQGKTDKELTDYLGISAGAMTKWKYDGGHVYLKHIEAICDFLETTPNYLFYGTVDQEPLTPAEKEVLQMYRNLDAGRKRCIRETLRYFSEKA